MKRKSYPIVTTRLEKIVGGGQALGALEDGRKLFVWGGLPGETVEVQLTRRKSSYAEGVVTRVLEPSADRVQPHDPNSYLSTSPWQIMRFEREQHYKAALIEEAFELHDIVLPGIIEVATDGVEYGYRNKIEFSFWWDNELGRLDVAFHRRGSHGKIAVEGTSLAPSSVNDAARRLLDVMRARAVEAYALKTVIIRRSERGAIVTQLYVKDEAFSPLTEDELVRLDVAGFELIFSNPKSPASIITTRLQRHGDVSLRDDILGVAFNYAAEGFFQINLPVYQLALDDMRPYIGDSPVIDMYSGVGSIGLTIGGEDVTLVESNEHAVGEMRRNIETLGREDSARAVLSPSEKALDHITGRHTIILDPPRAGLHEDVIARLLEQRPERIIYLSCNPVTQARDVARLAEHYGVQAHRGYNFFPRTPHIEHLVVLNTLGTS